MVVASLLATICTGSSSFDNLIRLADGSAVVLLSVVAMAAVVIVPVKAGVARTLMNR